MSTTFIKGDCIEEMRYFAEKGKKFNLISTSPPYNANKEYETNLTLKKYHEFTSKWVSAAAELMTDTGAMAINVGYFKTSPTTTKPIAYLIDQIAEKIGLYHVQLITWHFVAGMRYSKRFAHRSEHIVWLVKDPTNFTFNLDAVRDASLNLTNDKRNNPLGKNPTDVWTINRVVGGRGKSKEKTIHPCQQPEELVSRIIKAFSNEGDSILDPFGGAGTTGTVAVRNNRHCTLIERDERYMQVAKDRVLNSAIEHLDDFNLIQQYGSLLMKEAA